LAIAMFTSWTTKKLCKMSRKFGNQFAQLLVVKDNYSL
jgi:hypothetical protein